MRRYAGYPLSALNSNLTLRVPAHDHVNCEVPRPKPGEKWGPPPVAVRSISWEASAVGLSIQVFECGSLRKGKWGANSLQLYPIMIAMGTAGSWELDAATPVHFVDKHAHGRLCIANQADQTIHLTSLILWCAVLGDVSKAGPTT